MRRLFLIPLAALLLAGCEINIDLGNEERIEGSGERAEMTRDVSDFDAVSFSTPGTLIIEQTGSEGLRIEGDDNLLEQIITEVDGGTLTIRTRDDIQLDTDEPLRFYLSVDELERITLAGSGDVEADGLESDELTLSIAGAGDVRMGGLVAEELRVDLAGAGDIAVSGKVQEQVLSLAGAGDVNAEDLLSEETEVNIAGAGSARVHVRDRLEVNIMGAGSVHYRGTPEVIQSIMGVGSVEQIDG